MTLDQLARHERATVVSLDCHGPARRRLLDLGLLPGTEVHASMTSPLGDPTAYVVRGATIALRRVQARSVRVEVAPPTSATPPSPVAPPLPPLPPGRPA